MAARAVSAGPPFRCASAAKGRRGVMPFCTLVDLHRCLEAVGGWCRRTKRPRPPRPRRFLRTFLAPFSPEMRLDLAQMMLPRPRFKIVVARSVSSADLFVSCLLVLLVLCV